MQKPNSNSKRTQPILTKRITREETHQETSYMQDPADENKTDEKGEIDIIKEKKDHNITIN